MDQLVAMRLFARIVERRSFTLAAQDIGIPRSTATQVLKRLEDRLSARLLQRTTRTVTPTLDGEAYYRRCLAILADIEAAEDVFKGAKRADHCTRTFTARWRGTSSSRDSEFPSALSRHTTPHQRGRPPGRSRARRCGLRAARRQSLRQRDDWTARGHAR